MSELEEIEARAAERRAEYARNNPRYVNEEADDLDHAVAIAREERETKELGQLWLAETQKERDEATRRWRDAEAEIVVRQAQLDQAQADYAGLDEATRIRINELNTEIDRLQQGLLEAQRLHQDTKDQLRWARADVLRLRDALDGAAAGDDYDAYAWAETAHYEQYRETS